MSEVREVQPGDEDEVLAAYEWLFAPPGSKPEQWEPERARENLGRAMTSERSTVFVAIEDGGIAGICSAYLDLDSVRYGTRCWVEDLVVDPELRSRGTGKALLDAAKDWARQRGATHLELDSGLGRTDAHRFYEREEPSWESKCYAWAL